MHVASRANEVFSRGGLCQSGEGGPAVLPCCHINSDPLSAGETERERERVGEDGKGGREGGTAGRCEKKGMKKRGKETWTGVERGCEKRREAFRSTW